MYIRRKVFSIVEGEQKEFARKDYEGKGFIERKLLRRERNKLAKEIKRSNNQLKKDLFDNIVVKSKNPQGGFYEYELPKNIKDADFIYNREITGKSGRLNVGEYSWKAEAEEVAKRKAQKLKKAGKIGAGVVLASGAAYGGYKAYKHNKNKKSKEK